MLFTIGAEFVVLISILLILVAYQYKIQCTTENQCTTKKNHERCLEIVAEAIFLEKRSDGRKGGNIPLNVFQEFQLVLSFADFFSRPGPDVAKNAVFLCLFGDAQLPPGRSRVLSKFISTAISDSIAPVILNSN